MSANTHSSHRGHETTDFDSPYSVWAIPFSIVVLLVFVLIIVLWVPAVTSREMKVKEIEGAEAGRQSLLDQRALESEALESAGPDRMPVMQAMIELARVNASSGTP
jgi:hypothetical protein